MPILYTMLKLLTTLEKTFLLFIGLKKLKNYENGKYAFRRSRKRQTGPNKYKEIQVPPFQWGPVIPLLNTTSLKVLSGWPRDHSQCFLYFPCHRNAHSTLYQWLLLLCLPPPLHKIGNQIHLVYSS